MNTLKISKIKKYNKLKIEELNDNFNYSFILDLAEKNKFDEFLGGVCSGADEINESKKALNMSI